MKKILLLIFLLNYLPGTAQVTLTSSNLPIIIINTNGQQIPDDPKINATMGIINNIPGERNNVTDAFNEYNGNIGIEVRGQSSQMFPMKSYGIELRDKNGDNNDKALFGLPKESDWILYAPYTDKTLMRNFLAYAISNNLGRWAAHCRYTEVVLNGEYIGIYVFMEKIKRGKGRVNISKLDKDDNDGDNVTGGYIFSIDKDATAWYSTHRPPNSASGASIQYSYVYPKPEDITTQQKYYLKNYVDDFESALAAGNFQDSVTGFRKFADENSFIDYFIVNEVSRNVDGYRLSAFFNKNRNSISSRINAGPAWDYDLAFRNADYCDGSATAGWAYRFNYVCPADYWQVPFWWNRLMEDTAFRANLLCRWKEQRGGVLSIENINHQIDSVYTLVGEAYQRHFMKWPVLGRYVWPNPQPIPSTYAEEISTLKSWIAGRLTWMDNNLPQTGRCATAVATNDPEIRAWPNPILNKLILSITSEHPQTMELLIVNTAGQKLISAKSFLPQGPVELHYNTSAWPKGMYHVKVAVEDGISRSFTVVK